MKEISALAGLYRALEPLGIYALNRGSLIDHELAAYAAAFSLAEELLAGLERDAFVQTAAGQGLRAHERMAGFGERESLSQEARRRLVIDRRSVASHDFNVEGMLRSMRAAGLEAELVENCPEESVTVRGLAFLDEFDGLDNLKERLSQMLPAHLDWEFDTGHLTWDLLDGKDADWNRWDGADFTWDQFDIDGHSLL